MNGRSNLVGTVNELSLLSQLSASVTSPGTQLPESQLSSQLQSLLQGATSGSSPNADGLQSTGRAVGGSMLHASDVPVPRVVPGPSGVLWSGSGHGGLMPGWLPSEGLLSLKGDDCGSGNVAQLRDMLSGTKVLRKDSTGSIVGANGGSDRGGKAKKRGGTSNRGGGKGDGKSAHKVSKQSRTVSEQL